MAYQAPECFTAEVRDLSKVDVWALGLILYQTVFSCQNPILAAANKFFIYDFIMKFDIEADQNFKSLPLNSVERELLAGMLEPKPEKRLTVSQVL